MANTYTEERRTHLEALAELLPAQGLVSRMLGGDDPMLWVWHPGSGRQTIIFATPSRAGWVFLWSPGGKSGVDDLTRTARTLGETLASPKPG
ncbi:hypothetical protein GCM10012289_19110 [Nonomuraea cavernae]|uniref:Uncharacterized protein n=1 Tax=Nonomuraea cavernae TaxID=2045107 RepID=A0A917YW86_9ACTN|nr:hypothetical protein GCM10012289_19110 [Nonomuraea cavernae]